MRNITVLGLSGQRNPISFSGAGGVTGVGFAPTGREIVGTYWRYSQITGAPAGMRFGRSLLWPIKDGGLGATQDTGASTVIDAPIFGTGVVEGAAAGDASTNAPGNIGRIIFGTSEGVGTATVAALGVGNISGSIVIGFQPSAEDIAFTLLDNFEIESGLTVRQALRLISAVAAGNITSPATNTYTIRNAVQDSKARIEATGDGTVRTITAVDLT
jgi:hypothetical protein